MTTTKNLLSLNFSSEISIKDFSFSQLIIAVKHLFDTEGIPGLVKCLVTLIEALLIKSRVECPRSSYKNITDQSFRRGAKSINDMMGFSTSHTTLHRWFWDTDVVNLNQKQKVDFLVADGTGFKKDKDFKNSNRGEIKVLIGYNKTGEVIPFGAWTRASWKDIGNLIKNKNHPSDKIKFKTIAKTLITDGEEEIIRSLIKLAGNHQRCLFHMTHELTPLLRYQDFVNKEAAIKISDELQDLLYLELPETESDPLKSLEDKLRIEIHLSK